MKAVHSNRCSVSRRAFLGTAATAGTGILMPASAFARTHDGDRDDHEQEGVRPNPIPGGVAPLAPFGIFVHHKPPTPGLPLASINEPSQITDFSGFVGVTRIRGGGMGTNTLTGARTPLAFQADMGFNQGQFIGSDGKRHHGTFGFV